MLTPDEVMAQSQSAFQQWDGVWRSHAQKNGETMAKAFERGQGRKIRNLTYMGIGRNALIVAYAPSLEKHIDVIKQYKDNIDVICVDKAFGDLVSHGIQPKLLFTCDAGINYSRWFEPYMDKMGDTVLCMTVCGEPTMPEKWVERGGKICYFVHKDNIESEKIYGPISKCDDIIPAGSNVGNAAIIFVTSVCGYDNHYLLGYDYCWGDDENYYAFVDNEKRYWMNHVCMTDIAGRLVNTSQNLMFSARWMSDYNKAMVLPSKKKMYNVSGQGICDLPQRDIRRALKDSVSQRKLTEKEKKRVYDSRLETIVITDQNGGEERLKKEIETHMVTDVTLRYIPEEVNQWLEAI